MELVIRLNSGGEVSIPIQPDGVEQGVVHALFQPAGVTLLPDCAEDDFDRNGDCDGRVRECLVLDSGTYGKLKDETVFLCSAHRMMAAGAKKIRVFA